MGAARNSAASGFSTVLKRREFRLLWLAGAQSLLGDQLARVALAILVFNRTGSDFATAAIYAWTFLPAIAGNMLLASMADRLPRRRLLILGDVARAGLLAVMSIPLVSLPLLAALLTVVVLIGSPWKAAESALVVDLLPEQDYPLGVGLRAATLQSTQLIGFAVGGFTVAIVGARLSLRVDAATFLVSAGLIFVGIRSRPAPGIVDHPSRSWLGGVRTILADRRLRMCLGFSSLLGLLVVPEGLAAPYADGLGAGPHAVGLLLAAGPAGVLGGSIVYSRFMRPRQRAQLLGPLAVASGVPLLACLLFDNLPVTLVLWALSGACTAYQIQVITDYVQVLPAGIRGQGMGLASASLLAVQGLGLLLGGALSQIASAPIAVATAGGAASMFAVALIIARRDIRAASIA